jgi:hypothetical protein
MAYSRVSVTAKISAPAEKVWEQIGSFANIKPIMQGAISDCAVDRSGTIRKLKVKGAKGIIAERLVKYDSLTHTQIYSIIDKPNNIVPFVNYTATIKVKPSTSRSCTVVWSSRFEPKKGQTVEGCKEFAKGIYETGIGGVKKRVVVSKSPDKKPKKPKKKASSGRKK